MEKGSKTSTSTLEKNKTSTKNSELNTTNATSSIPELNKAEQINKEIDSNLKQQFEQAKELQSNVHGKIEENLKDFHAHSKQASDHLSNMTRALNNLTTTQTKAFYSMNAQDHFNYLQKLPNAIYDSFATFWNTYNNELLNSIEESNKNPKDLHSYNKILFTASVHAPLKSYTHCLERFHEIVSEQE
jgi:hypothetical protein